ncbi:hypothetical protein H0194_06300 [Corynebacterium incognita]|uniref:Uncharacterized protein n=1 Tax=Corynebacterium incognita TaxID=2754725 RepID=A0A7G7CM98_9CORY|nr:hypothetical protein [Corynebacterium incognita]QNE88714.1 hypothetical protein H0194_06300 [Corynebacterium incognita]
MADKQLILRRIVPFAIGGMTLGMHASYRTGLADTAPKVFWLFFGVLLIAALVLCFASRRVNHVHTTTSPPKIKFPGFRDAIVALCLFGLALIDTSYAWIVIYVLSIGWMLLVYFELKPSQP